jgi:hypothetical protein
VHCTVCRSEQLVAALSLGEQPPSNRFVSPDLRTPEQAYPLSLGYCRVCATMQLVERMPIEAVRPRHEWLTYNEPEGHLDEVARKLTHLPGIDASSRVMGATYKDKSTLERLKRLGLEGAHGILEDRLAPPLSPFGLETVQHTLSDSAAMARMRDAVGTTDVLLARHIIEHAWDTTRFIGSLREMIAPGGYLVLELPDSERILRANNHAFIWEEHLSYFTEACIGTLAQMAGARLVSLERYPYRYEDSLVAVMGFPSNGEAPRATRTESMAAHVRSNAGLLTGFARALEDSKARWHEDLETCRARGERVAVFGAGHLAVKFINFLGLALYLDCVVDDHPRKRGLLMPGSMLPIVASDQLDSRGIKLCLSTLSPESEIKVRSKLQHYFSSGGRMVSAFGAA